MKIKRIAWCDTCLVQKKSKGRMSQSYFHPFSRTLNVWHDRV
jgi:hypothetical protein